jgi:hypothetical protein
MRTPEQLRILPVKFRLDPTGPDEANLVRIPSDGPPSLRMVRDNSWT